MVRVSYMARAQNQKQGESFYQDPSFCVNAGGVKVPTLVLLDLL